jgi:hypothetical protein
VHKASQADLALQELKVYKDLQELKVLKVLHHQQAAHKDRKELKALKV